MYYFTIAIIIVSEVNQAGSLLSNSIRKLQVPI